MGVTIEAELKEKLSDEKILFIEKSIERVHAIDKILNDDKHEDSVRFLYVKELYSIFTELRNIDELKPLFEQLENENLVLVYETVKFIRNVLAHFPYFATWDEIWISENHATKLAKVGKTIQKFLQMQNENKAGGVLLKLHLDASGNHEIKDGQIKLLALETIQQL